MADVPPPAAHRAAPVRSAVRIRTRDPERKDKILDAAAALVAERGFIAVSMSDIGSAAGVTGSAIYRHFESKSAVLVALFDKAIDTLLDESTSMVADSADSRSALLALVAGQIDFVITTRNIARVYYTENYSLPPDDQRRLRRKQRLYIEEWAHLYDELHPNIDESTTRVVVHAAIGAIQSSLFHNVGLPEKRLRDLLFTSACSILDLDRPER